MKNIKKLKYLVIGSNSFSGSSFIDAALSKNHKVVGVSRSKELKSYFLKYKKNPNINKFKFFRIDINNDEKKIKKIILKYKPEIIVNFAAQSMVSESWDNPEHWYNTNITSSSKLIKIVKSCSFVKKYINFTTPEVYGSTKNWIEESFYFNPNTPYAISRAAFDYHLLAMFKTFNFPVIFVRAANVYGPGQQLYRIIPKTIMCIKNNKKISLHGGGKSIRSFIHIDDVSSALMLIAEKGMIGNTYHVSGKTLITIRELVNNICKILKKDFKKFTNISKERPGKDMAYKLKSKKVRKMLRWKDNIKLQKGLEDVISWVNLNYKFLKKQTLIYKHKK